MPLPARYTEDRLQLVATADVQLGVDLPEHVVDLRTAKTSRAAISRSDDWWRPAGQPPVRAALGIDEGMVS